MDVRSTWNGSTHWRFVLACLPLLSTFLRTWFSSGGCPPPKMPHVPRQLVVAIAVVFVALSYSSRTLPLMSDHDPFQTLPRVLWKAFCILRCERETCGSLSSSAFIKYHCN